MTTCPKQGRQEQKNMKLFQSSSKRSNISLGVSVLAPRCHFLEPGMSDADFDKTYTMANSSKILYIVRKENNLCIYKCSKIKNRLYLAARYPIDNWLVIW